MNRRVVAALWAAILIAVAGTTVPTTAQAQTAPAEPPPAAPATVPVPKPTLPTRGGRTFAGHDGRWTVGGRWLIRHDPDGQGRKARWFAPGAATGWSPVRVPHVWNAQDHTSASQKGAVVWYRRELRLPKVSRTR
ncbi:MAG: hypothetical protein ITG02_15530, partial [Patulibacter sp.]|nr:hypothetical protein [Patulibacter sp.]